MTSFGVPSKSGKFYKGGLADTPWNEVFFFYYCIKIQINYQDSNLLLYTGFNVENADWTRAQTT